MLYGDGRIGDSGIDGNTLTGSSLMITDKASRLPGLMQDMQAQFLNEER
jgi:hypothetical protein